jgi:predicted SAM-dependent methyltransferase
MSARGIRRLNWGCGSSTLEGWINSDIKDLPGVDLVGSVLDGLPFETDSIDYAVSVHALQESWSWIIASARAFSSRR